MVEEFVEHGKVPTASTVPARWARSIIQTLCTARIEPVAAEVAASLGAIRTQCVARRCPPVPFRGARR